MGLSLFRSNDCYPDQCISPAGVSKDSYTIPQDQTPNPDPNNYKIKKATGYKIGDKKYLLVLIEYPDCTNYEGKKILVYDGIDKSFYLTNQKLIDPHFSENKNYISPIARFEPTEKGWKMACAFIEVLLEENL